MGSWLDARISASSGRQFLPRSLMTDSGLFGGFLFFRLPVFFDLVVNQGGHGEGDEY